ncbi:ribosome biogenesis GTPase YlqF [Alicyclobacillus sp. TC]|uniref:ribosome biogenesis GTPase YlqF n=1 Tax=Alicyclobacillus sp. TC TaxID=2606450 RepID=UPI001EE4E38B|nr:ribosome biogenesis GTPase YlqF [Alicyclobacillus sp. TC]
MQTIQWFPGHMAKARREIQASIKMVDAIIELVDARLPMASSNPLLKDLIGARPRLLVMTRKDLADESQTKQWLQKFEHQGISAIAVDAQTGSQVQRIIPALEMAAKAKREREARRGMRPRPLRTMVVGIPNVGKSSLINRLAKRSAVKTGDRPGITKAQQWVRIGSIELLDTPGVLWPKIDSPEDGYLLAMSGAIKPEILDHVDLALHALQFLIRNYPHLVEERWQIEAHSYDSYSLDEPEGAEAFLDLFEKMTRMKGMLMSGARPDLERMAESLLRELQTGKLGRVSFEWVHGQE